MSESKYYNIFILTISSVIFVSIMFNLFIRNEYDFSFLLIEPRDITNLALLDKHKTVQYIIVNRLKQLIAVMVLIKAFGTNRMCNIFVVVLGGLLGLFISCQVYYIGLLGLVILLIYLMPHGIIYLWGICYSYKSKLFYIKEESGKKLLIFVMIFLIGVVVECIFMTFFLKNFYQYMVT